VDFVAPCSALYSLRRLGGGGVIALNESNFIRQVTLRSCYGASPAVWDPTVLRATRHRWTRPALTPAK